jgi:light-regulated signal transduction histidine kinase (bacteriophytochrome)
MDTGALHPEFRAALASCDREPIHIPGSIQPFGVLLALNEDLSVSQFSLNALSYFKGEQIAPLHEWMTSESINELKARILPRDFDRSEPFEVRLKPQAQSNFHAQSWNGFIHRYRGQLILELEPRTPDSENADQDDRALYVKLRGAISRLQSAQTVQDFCETLVREIQSITQYNGVMVYRFHEDLHGEIIAEKKQPGFPKYLGHHYPASDIPAQARAVFLQNWLRMIPDRNYSPVPIHPILRPGTDHPLDLGKATLRSVSPIHIEYLRNMGVTASLTVSLIKDGYLWGLIACHHYEGPKYISHEIRAACETLGRLASSLLPTIEARETKENRIHVKSTIARLDETMQSSKTLEAPLIGTSPNLLDLVIGASGAAIHIGDQWERLGDAPPSEELTLLTQWLNTRDLRTSIFHTDSLPRIYSRATQFAGQMSGVLAIRIPKNASSWILWFKPETPYDITWAGNPEKPVSHEDSEAILHPRKSFSEWIETVRLKSLPWSSVDIEAAIDLQRVVTANDLKRQFQLEQKARAEAESASRQREELLRIISHDLKTPLTTFRLNLNALRLDDLKKSSANTDKLIESMNRTVTSMSRLIDDVLSLARSEEGQMPLETTGERADVLLDEVKEILGPIARQKNITLEIRPPENVEYVHCDRGRISQVLSNLVSNAVKFTPDRGTVTVAADPSDREILFSVHDTGLGISEQDLPHVFDRFWQASHAKQMGTGLGLAIAKGIVEAHGGRIWAKSRLGSGSTFYFTLPKAAQH